MSLSNEIIDQTEKYGAHNYHPLPVVLKEAKGIWVTDVEGKKYMDFLSAYSAVNFGHNHPKIVKALKDQADILCLTSRAFHNNLLGNFLQRLCDYSGFDMALPMNTGAEAIETALKMARRWGNEVKKIPNGKQEIIFCENNFHGRTITIVSASTDPTAKDGYGPYTPGIVVIPFNDAQALEKAINENTCAFVVEPIQGEAGVIVPDGGYLKAVRKICTEHNVLFIADEVQTGFCRTGARFACDLENVKPDAMCLGKALGGGVYPVSAVVARKDVMKIFTPGSHGSTFGGNPLACAVGMASLALFKEQDLSSHSHEMGEYLRKGLRSIKHPQLQLVRGKGLLNAVVFKEGFNAWDICVKLKEKGLIAKQTHGHIIRFAPPLTISKDEIDQALKMIRSVLES